MNKVLALLCLLVLAGGCILEIGCGSNNKNVISNIEKVAGVYTSKDMNLFLDSDGSVTLDMPSEPHPILGRGGSFSCDGKEIKIKFPGDKNVITFKVAGDNLVGISQGVEGKILKKFS